MKKEVKKACATWRISLNVFCPYCDNLVDLMDEQLSDHEYPYEFGVRYKEDELDEYDQYQCDTCYKTFQLEIIEF